MKNLIIRVSKSDDAIDLARNCFLKNTVDEVTERLALYDDLGDDGHLFVAEVNGEVVGTASVRRSGQMADINSVVVTSRYQQNGIARRLIHAIEQKARDWNVSVLSIGARIGSIAKTAYEHIGFVEMSRAEGVIRLEKPLS